MLCAQVTNESSALRCPHRACTSPAAGRTSITGTVPTGFVFSITNAPGDGYLTILSDTNYAQPTNSIEVGESLVFQFAGLIRGTTRGVITNTAIVSQHTTIDGTNNVFERYEPPTNSTALLPLPSYTVAKILQSPSTRSAFVGETVTFRVVVTNTGSVGLNPVRGTPVSW